MSGPIVAHPPGKANFPPLGEAQSFTIRCAECGDDLGTHLSHCPGVIAAGYDAPGLGAFSSTVYPTVGGNFCKHQCATSALRFYLMFGPVELHFADGRVLTMDDLPGGFFESAPESSAPESGESGNEPLE
ncbi:hypothetical protein [Glycomyces buryatensis]|uniref:Uncharacterized protein n=1 Tax=Glycomyces buryatensis TaxID=2570927 RepID=A0A4S8Q7R7_9ACTN|nr:hypothetical protein [Glycomyces buryatensis]THV40190.1 hypothetical protein FAB82_15970 [Glycomyces buryatensis]